ncbi:aminoglycoside phosphotransferase family protein [bacterium]|nr:MAG: aminoglycoside phosphotransferase family protein [bacterium]RPI95857.1 MAG: aminoglycoside phosphotransferase family protein [Chloroflexota bacterium]
MADRQEHREEVHRFLQEHLSNQDWRFSLPHGTGMETYAVQGNEQSYFVKVGAPVERYLAMAEIGLTPPVLRYGQLESGASVMVQPFIDGRNPSRRDYWDRLENVARIIRTMHHHPHVRATLPPVSSNRYRDAGLRALNLLRQKWQRYKAQVPKVAEFVDKSLDHLDRQINLFSGEGIVSSHGDICNGNWLFASDGKVYIVDLESMSMDDPALDLGALLWWYYPPELRQRFLDIAGYRCDDEFKFHMQIRMAMHCLHITLPREQSFDRFEPNDYDEALTDFRAILDGKENPQGYNG